MKLLVVEDERRLAEYLHKGLSEEGHVVELAHDGVDGLHLALQGQHDLIVLDVMLPGIDGFALLTALRQSKPTPVIMLSARMLVEDRVRGLKAGADDYLVKPFAFSELVARIEVLMRRSQPGAADGAEVLPARHAVQVRLTVADLALDLARHRATRAGQRLDLTAKEFMLLALLMRRQGEVLSRTEIAEQVWDIHFNHATNVIDVAVRRLRAKLDAPFAQPLLHTVRGIGYVLEQRAE